MSDDKRTAAIAMLEAELERRIQARVDAGELVRREVIFTGCHFSEMREDWIERVEGGPDILWEPMYIVTGVPRPGDDWVPESIPEATPAIGREDRLPPPPLDEPAEPPAYVAPDQPSTRVFVVVSNGDDNDPGQVEHGRFSVEGGVLTLTDTADKYLGAKRLRETDTPMSVARALLRESLDSTAEFNRRLVYPPFGVA
jgi:hypothetical protein